MRIAMTGAHGFIGTYCARMLASDGHEIAALVRDPVRAQHIREICADFVVGDMRDVAVQQRLCRDADCVVHAAADWEAVRSADLRMGVEVNLLSSLRLLETARLADVGQFIFISSTSVYSERVTGRAMDETHPAWPHSQYGAWKAAVEPYLKAYHQEHGLNTISLRPCGVYGLPTLAEHGAWAELVGRVMRGKPVEVDRGCEMVHVLDCAEAVRRCAGNAAVAGRFYNLVDCYVSERQVAEIARQICGSSSEIVVGGEGEGDRRFDMSAARSLGIPLNRGLEGVREYVEDLVEAMK